MSPLFERMKAMMDSGQRCPYGSHIPMPVKTLTIYQPWASLVVAGAKPYEFRAWSVRERGPAYAALIGQRINIHAAAKDIDFGQIAGLIAALEAGGDRAAATCLIPDLALPVLRRAADRSLMGTGKHGNLPWSCVLGTAVLGEPKSGYDVAEEFGLPKVNDSDRDEHAHYGWPMLEVEQWDQPVHIRGLQGFWSFEMPEGYGL